MVLSLSKILEAMNALEDKNIPIAYKIGNQTSLTKLTVGSFIQQFNAAGGAKDPDSPMEICLHHIDAPPHEIVDMGVAENIWFFLVQEKPNNQLH